MLQESPKKKRYVLLTLSNGLSLFRAPLAFLFLQEHVGLRLTAILLAMITDSVDGYVARRFRSASKFGAILDPAMDKFFVYFALAALLQEGKISLLESLAMVSRDFSVVGYGFCMAALKRWGNIEFKALRWGKVATSLQFVVLMGLVLNMSFPWGLFAGFVVMGFLALVELLQGNRSFLAPSKSA